MKVMSEAGFNRVSFGIQDFNEKVQVAVHRVQPYSITKDAMDLARKYNMLSVNTDLIYGLPYQTFNSFKETLNQVLTLNPDRLAVFNYAHVPWMKKSMRKIDETTLPHPSEKLKILKYTIDFFEGNGYKMVGNAVPPNLAYYLAKKIFEDLSTIYSEKVLKQINAH